MIREIKSLLKPQMAENKFKKMAEDLACKLGIKIDGYCPIPEMVHKILKQVEKDFVRKEDVC